MPIYSAEEYNQKHGQKIKRNPLPTDCATSNYPRELHDEETWRFLQDVFHETSYASKSYHHRTHARHRNAYYSGVDDYYVEARNDVTNRGRGMYAIRDIPRGTQLWYYESDTWTLNDGYWNTKEKMIDYLERLPYELQCDVLLWAYAALPLGRNKFTKPWVECNLDEASYFNHAERPELVNMGGLLNIAYRDIRKGEELLLDYGSFIALGDASIPWWDELRNTAWNEPASSVNSSANALHDSLSSSSADLELDDPSECMDGYVKYGAPKTSSAFVEAAPVHGRPKATYGLGSTLAGLYLCWVLSRGFVAAVGMRRTR